MANKSILIVDDNPGNLKLTSYLLELEGYEVRTAANAKETRAILLTFGPQLILMDLQLPGMDGFELTRRIKAEPELRHIVVIAVTAYAMNGDEQRALAAGCDGYVTKPIDTRALPALIARLLAGLSENSAT